MGRGTEVCLKHCFMRAAFQSKVPAQVARKLWRWRLQRVMIDGSRFLQEVGARATTEVGIGTHWKQIIRRKGLRLPWSDRKERGNFFFKFPSRHYLVLRMHFLLRSIMDSFFFLKSPTTLNKCQGVKRKSYWEDHLAIKYQWCKGMCLHPASGPSWQFCKVVFTNPKGCSLLPNNSWEFSNEIKVISLVGMTIKTSDRNGRSPAEVAEVTFFFNVHHSRSSSIPFNIWEEAAVCMRLWA